MSVLVAPARFRSGVQADRLPARRAFCLSCPLVNLTGIGERDEGTWRGSQTESDWRRSFDKYVFPRVGDIRVDQVTLEDVTGVVQPCWNGRGSTGYLVRQRLDAVLRWAVVKHSASTTQLTRLWLSSPRSAGSPIIARTFPIRDPCRDGGPAGVLGARGCQGRSPLHRVDGRASLRATGAVWSEIHFDDRVWTLSPDRMKAGREHEVPLSAQAIELLRRRQRGRPACPFVFRFVPPADAFVP